jgi:hypothetical protein
MATGPRLKREHIVAAGLVGTVVVVVGFASGLGMRPQTDDTAQAQPAPPVRTPVTRTTTTPPPPNTGSGGSGGGAGGGGGGFTGGGNPVPQPIQGRPDPVIVTPTHSAHPPAPTTPPTSTPSTTPSLPPCDPGLLRTLVDTVDSTVGGLTGLLGLPTEPLAPVTDPLLGTACQLPSSTSSMPPSPVPSGN